MVGIGDRVKRLEEQVAELTARARAEDAALQSQADPPVNHPLYEDHRPRQGPVTEKCRAVGCTAGSQRSETYCEAHATLLCDVTTAIAATRQAIETAEDSFGWEVALRGLLQARRAIVGPEAQPAPVATVGVQCPSCLGCGVQTAPYKPGQLEVTWESCPYCLGAGLVHTDADYQRAAQELDLYRRALIAACHDIGFGQADVDRFLAEAAQEADDARTD